MTALDPKKLAEEYPGQSEDIAHERYIKVTLDRLADDLREAAAKCGSAKKHLRQLTSGDAWYVELAEGVEGSDAEDEIADAMRALRNVERIVDRHVAVFAAAPAAKGAEQ